MESDNFGTLLPKEHYEEYLKQNTRPDGRELGEFRKLTINIGSIKTAHGSSLVQLGDTMVVCGVKAELTKPPASEPSKGIIVPNVDLPPLCAAHFKPGPPSEQAQITSQFLDDLLKNCNVIDLDTLCLHKDKLVWVLYSDIVCLNYDGNLIDACVMALSGALLNTKLPEVSFDEETETVKTNSDPKARKNIALNRKIFAATYVLFEKTHLLADPTFKEEDITSGCVTVVTDDNAKVCNIHRPGGFALTDKQLQKCIGGAIENGKKLLLVLDEVSNT